MSSVMGTRGVMVAQAVSEALAAIRVGAPGDVLDQALVAERLLGAAVPEDTGDTLPRAALACVEAAREHLHYGELQEARMLLTEAGKLLARRAAVNGRSVVADPAQDDPEHGEPGQHTKA